MNRFLLLTLAVVGLFLVPFLIWSFQEKTPVTMNEATLSILEENEGLAWLFRYSKFEENSDSQQHLTILPQSFNRTEWDETVTREDQQLLLLSRVNWLSLEDELLAREVQEYVGILSTGWIIAYFEDLSLSNPLIPDWAKQDQEGYEGSGFIFANELLEETMYVPSVTPFVQGNEKMVESSYSGWVEVTRPVSEEEVSLWFALPEEIEEELKTLEIPLRFPAILSKQHGNTEVVYMAASLEELESPPAIYQLYGLLTIYKYFYQSRGDSTYWTTFVPSLLPIIDHFKEPVEKSEKPNIEFSYHSRIQENRFQVRVDDEWQDLIIKGVNLGMGKPGYFPGEAAISEEEYYRWFKQISEMNANTIRIYTVHPPGFYRALKRFNETSKQPLYLLHGAWVEEEPLEEYGDAYNPETMEKFEKEYKDVVDLVHGNKRIPPQVGHASGIYDADISEYVLGWLVGIEWYPEVVIGTNEAHEGVGDYQGTYIETKDASPFEHWLAEHMDQLLSYEQEHYNRLRPISFSNWVTTDLLDHPSEPLEEEDMVSVNPNVIHLKQQMQDIGQFASYHVYPYYPDFFNVDLAYSEYIDQDGDKNSYAGYLNDLQQAHNMPVLIAEFGIPASRGATHVNPYGWNQGNVDEKAQGEIIAKLYRTILAEEYLGGLVFSWQDEWFKRTWNTMDYDNPERRPYWSNQQTNEQHFGLLSFDSMKIQPDGERKEWQEDPLVESESVALAVTHDEAYLYIRIDGISEQDHVLFTIDTLADQGNTTMQQFPELTFSSEVEFVGELNGQESRLWIDTYYDFYHYLYGNKLGMIDPVSTGKKDSGQFTPIYYVLNKEIYYPELDRRDPFHYYETGKLERGNANPESLDYNSLSDYEYGEDFVEIRLPWLLLQFRDPSQKEVIGDVFKNGDFASNFIDAIQVGVVIKDEEGKIENELPMTSYSWETWNQPTLTERLKPSYYILKEVFGQED